MSLRTSVAMVAACPYPSGQGTQALIGELARGLTARGHRIHLVCYAHAGLSRAEPFPVHRAWGPPGYRRVRSGPDPVKPFIDLGLAWTTARVVRQQACALIHAHNYEGLLAGWLAARAYGVPLVYHAHNWMATELPAYFEGRVLAALARLLGEVLDRSLPRRADRVLALHAGLADRLSACGVDPARLAVVAPGIDPGFWTAGPRPRRVADRVVYCGNLDAYQDLGLLFSAMRRVVEQRPAAHLLLATPNDPDQAERLAAARGAGGLTRVVPAAEPGAARAALRSARVAVTPRTSPAGFPVKILNALAAGTPQVACRPALAGLGLDGLGLDGLVVCEPEPEDFAAAIVQLLREPARGSKLGRSGQRLVRSRFSAERMCAQVEREWQQVM